MKFVRSLNAIDSHTMGEPTRIITGGVPHIPGQTMAEKKAYLETQLDELRTSVMLEPRGHNDMFGSIITAPVNEEADFGIIFMDAGGYLNMCGHGMIGAVTVAIETGMIKAVEPITTVKVDTPAGLIVAEARVESGKAKSVSIINVPAFLYKKDVKLNIDGFGEVLLDISFGGSFFAILDVKQLGLSVEPKNASQLSEWGLRLRDIINREVKVEHPELSHINKVDLVEFYDSPSHPEAHYKNAVVFGQGQVDRSPCGTGTSAKLATLYAKGELKENEDFIYESILGTLFKGKIVGLTDVGQYAAIKPEITGSAFITGFSQFVIDPEDPLKYGFSLK